MIRYFAKVLGTHFRSGRSLYFLTLFGVALGVASVLSIQIINRNALAAFEGSMAAVSGEADLSVMPLTPTMPESLYVRVLADRDVSVAWPVYRVDVSLVGRASFHLEVLGLDFYAPVQVPWTGDAIDLGASLGERGWAAVTPKLAGEMNWAVGDTFEVSSGSRRVALRVGALVDFQAMSPLASPRLVVMDIAQVQNLLGRPGVVHQIDLEVRSGADRAALAVRLEQAMGPGVRVMTPEQRRQQAEGLLSAFRLNLTAMSLISLFVGLFLVYSSTQAALVRRRAEFGVLRSMGATRAQVFGLILAEVALLGGLGVLLGLPMGYWAARSNVEMVSATLTNLYLMNGISELELPVWLYFLAGLIGVGGAVGGALLPAADVSRRDTRNLLAAFTLHERIGSVSGRLFGCGIGILAAAALWYLAWGEAFQPAGFVLGIALLFGLPLMTPYVVKKACGLIPARGFGFRYSLKGLAVRLHTTSFAVASLGIAVSMLVGITLMVGSFRETLRVWVAASIRADVYVTTPSWRGRGDDATLSPELIRQMRGMDDVTAVDRLRAFTGYSGEQRVGLAGVDIGLPGGEVRFPLLAGERVEAFRQVREDGAVLIGETLARRANLWPGDEVPVWGPNGEIRFRIAGVYYDYSTEGGAVVLDRSTMAAHFGPGPTNSLALYLAEGMDAERFVDELKDRYVGVPLLVRSNQRLRKDIFQIFDQTFAVTRLLQVMSLLIAVCGITLMLLVLAREQVSELALYRAIGATRRQIFRVYLGKGLGMGAFGLVMGLAGGLALAAVLIFVINRAYFGWTIQIFWPWATVAQQCAMILAAAVLASLYPALKASKTPAAELNRENV